MLAPKQPAPAGPSRRTPRVTTALSACRRLSTGRSSCVFGSLSSWRSAAALLLTGRVPPALLLPLLQVTCGHDQHCFQCLTVWSGARALPPRPLGVVPSLTRGKRPPPDQSRKCPLCSRPMGDYLLHDLESRPPYVKVRAQRCRATACVGADPDSSLSGLLQYFLPPFVKPSTAHPQHPALPPARRRQYPHPRRTERAPSEEGDFERRLERRREIYRYGLYAKVSARPFLASSRDPGH
jgi:hypothetical protein